MKLILFPVLFMPLTACGNHSVITSASPAINLVYWEAGLAVNPPRMVVPWSAERLKKSGVPKSINSDKLYQQLLKVSRLKCDLTLTENRVAVATTKDFEIHVLLNKRIATKTGVCDIPFSEADSILRQLGLNIKNNINRS